VLGLTVLGSDDILPELFRSGVQHAFVALGDNRARLSVSQRLAHSGFRLVNAVSRRAVVSRHARLGTGVAIMPGAVINADAVLEDGAIVNTGASIDHDCRIGRYAHIAPGSSLAGNVTIGEGVLLGAGSSVIPGRSVGPWSIIGAGEITAVGVPARVVKRQDTPA
jgi:UDP-perosamine 4-acetyltransferase